MKLLVCVSLLFVLFTTATAFSRLICWTCENAAGNADCLTSGRQTVCRVNQNACENEVRRGSFGMLVTKRCKQALACQNNYIQNPRTAWFPTQCNSDSPSSVCRCCCGTNLCNRPQLECLPPPTGTTTTRTTPTAQNPVKGCNPPPFSFMNGELNCPQAEVDGRYEVGTRCIFRCNSGYTMVGNNYTECESIFGFPIPVFTGGPPICQPPPTCSSPPEPINGRTVCEDQPTSNGGYALGSKCRYECNDGYFYNQNAVATTTCQASEFYSGFAFFQPGPPFCQREPPTCQEPEAPESGKKTCSSTPNARGRFYLGTVCSFACDQGYELDGETLSECLLEADGGFTASFSPEPPICRFVPTCDPPEIPINGRTECRVRSLPISGKYPVGAVCDYICDSGFAGEEGAEMVTECHSYEGEAEPFAEFSPEPPVCVEDTPRCSVIDDISMGTVTCLNENFVGSTCFFRCNEGYQLFPSNHQSSTCRSDSTWSRRTPCCLRSCPPQAFMDLVIVLDSSSSIGEANWPIMLNFVRDFINNFDIEEDAARIGLIRYNNDIDLESQILLNQFPDSKSDLLEEVLSLPYDGEGTKTGNAIRHVRDVMFTPGNGDRSEAPNVVLVVTDGNAQDSTLLLEQAALLRNEDTSIFALGIVSQTAGLNVQELLTISGSPSRLLILNQGFSQLDQKLARLLGQTVCTARTCKA